jgi:hypothetical protein
MSTCPASITGSASGPAAINGFDSGRRKLVDWVIALAIALVVLAALVATSRDYALVFDEGFTVDRELTLVQWFEGVASPPPGLTRSDYFAPGTLESFWRFSRKEPDGHPPFYALIGLAGWWLARAWVVPLTAYRFGPMLLSSLTCALVYKFLAGRHGRIAGLTAAFALVLSPRTFAHAHYAHYDMPVTCLWLLAQIAFVRSLEKARWIIVFGILLGLAAGTKFTGWFALAPPLLWWGAYEGLPIARRWLSQISVVGRPRLQKKMTGLKFSATRALVLGVPIAALTLYAVQPPWWRSPLHGLGRFLTSNLTREETVPVSSLYLGTLYRFGLPWHNTIVLSAVTTPVLIVVLGAVGIGVTLAGWRSRREDVIWPLSWSVLMIVRALPNAPGHDVERLLLPSLASLSVLAGIGAGWLARRPGSSRLALVAPVLSGLALGECLVGIGQTYPYNLSYYNVAVGGLPGAERLGFDETYYLDTLGPEFFDWARRRSEKQPLELHFPIGILNMIILRHWGALPEGLKVDGLDQTERPFYVLQRNRSIYAPLDWWLERHGHPVFVIRRQGVELLRVYSAEEVEQAVGETRGGPGEGASPRRPAPLF